MVAQAPVGVVAPGVDVGAVLQQSERLLQVRAGVGVVGLQQSFLFVFKPVAAGGEAGEFVGLGGHELVELVVQHPGEGFAVSHQPRS
ncbi:hypothetical protein [Gordonia sp. 'Campus']|uniref:hypothetical protein n=1 Tax=Gordonia sp. 'Campus' TaxID=2915824 RepID=UPI001EE4BC3D|nr:hypothetical protein [Gordonia sp. 'Campus']